MMNATRLGLLNAVRTSGADAARVGTGGSTTRLCTARQGTVQTQKRQYHLVYQNTTFNKNGGVQDPGHIQLRTTPEEQHEFGVAPIYGHYRDKSQPKSRDHPIEGKLHAQLADGREFSVKGFVAPALKATDDPARTQNIQVEVMHKLTEEQAERLKQFNDRHIMLDYEVSGDLGMNCVHGLKFILEEVYQIPFALHKHETPQDAAVKLREQINQALEKDGL
jgi:hypothetical protein